MGSSFLPQNGQFSRHVGNSRSSESRSRSGCESRSFVSGSCWTYRPPLLVLTTIISSQSSTPNITSRKSSPPRLLPLFGFRDVHSGSVVVQPGSLALMIVLVVSAIYLPCRNADTSRREGNLLRRQPPLPLADINWRNLAGYMLILQHGEV